MPRTDTTNSNDNQHDSNNSNNKMTNNANNTSRNPTPPAYSNTNDNSSNTPTSQQQTAWLAAPTEGQEYCKPVGMKNTTTKSFYGRMCQICSFEMRARISRHVIMCSCHSIRTCIPPPTADALHLYNPNLETNTQRELTSDWMAPETDNQGCPLSCWDKAHNFYLPWNLYHTSNNGRANTWYSNELFKACQRALGIESRKKATRKKKT